MEFSIRSAELDDVDGLERLEKKCFSLPWTREQLIGQLPDDTHVFLVAENAQKELLGYIGMMYVLDEGYISNVASAPEYRRCGVGSALIHEMLAIGEKLELSFITLEVRESNAPAIALYAKYDFKKVGVRKNYYDFPNENAILMTKLLKRGTNN